jgi:hypothetical protein
MALGFARQIRMRDEAEHIHPIVEADEDHAFLGKVRAVVLILGDRAAGVPPPWMNPITGSFAVAVWAEVHTLR